MKKLFFFSFVLCLTLGYSQHPFASKFNVGDEFPKFKLKTVNKEKITSESYKGKILFVNFWFIACKPCKEEIPELNLLKEKYGDEVEFLAFTFDNQKKVEKFLEKKPFRFTQFVYAVSFVKNRMGINSYPTSMIVDSSGIIRHIHRGGIPKRVDYQAGKIITMAYEFLEAPLIKVIDEELTQ